MSTISASAAEMLPQLESARKLALSDAQVYTQVIPGILPIIGPGAPLEVRRWGAEFLAEGFASPLLQTGLKEQMVSDVLPALKTMLDNPNEDVMVVKCAIQASASVYALVFSRVYVILLLAGCDYNKLLGFRMNKSSDCVTVYRTPTRHYYGTT